MKKKLIIITSIVIVLLAAITVVAIFAGGGNESNLPALPDTDEEVFLGAAYEVAATLIGENGTEYTVEQATVYRNSDGKTVQQIYGMFDIDNLLGYKIVYTASSGVRQVTQTHTLYVKDGNKPVISTEAKHVAEVGVKYTFPQITVKDNSREELTCDVQVYRAGETQEKVEQEADGFTPDQVGWYDLRLKVADSSGNIAEATYSVYARYTRLDTEIDSFDDEGMYYTAYSQSGNVKQQAQFSPFRRLSTSKGSAYFTSGAGEFTGIYIAPRHEAAVMDKVGEDGYISAWVYIATLRNSKKTVFIGNTELTVPTNVWHEIRITKELVAQWPTCFSKLSSYSLPLLNVVNDGEDYTVFIDDIFAVKKDNISISMDTETHYPAGKELTVKVSGGNSPITEYYYAGQSTAFEGSFVPKHEGEYLITVYNQDRTALTATAVTVGELDSEVRTTQWYVKGEDFPVPELNVYDAGKKVKATTTTWKLDLISGEKQLMGKTANFSENVIVLYSESVVDGRTTALLQFITLNDVSFGAWFDTDAPKIVDEAWHWENLELSWLEELDGEQGVVAITNTTGGEGYFQNREFWKTPFTKEHYKRCTKLVFKLKADVEGARLRYLDEPTWTQLGGELIPTEWTEYAVDFESIYNNFSGYVDQQMFWTIGSEPYTIYISDIYAVIEDELKTINVYQGVSCDIAQHPSFEGCEIVECSVTKNGYSVAVNGTSFIPTSAGMFTVTVTGYDHMGLYFENTFKVNSVGASMWNDFNDPQIASVWANGFAKLTWLDSYAGAEGVLKMTNSGNHAYIGNTNGVNWPALREREHYYGVTTLKLRLRLEDNEGANMLTVWGQNGVWSKTVFSGVTSTDGWADYYIAFDSSTEFDAMNGMYFQYWSGDGSTLYIDEITILRLNLKEPEGMWYSFQDPTSGSVPSSGATLTWLESHDGADGVLKMTNDGVHAYVGNTNGINWPAAHAKKDYANATALKFRVKLEDTEGANMLYVVGQNDAFYYRIFEGITSTDGWKEYIVKFDFAEQFDAMNGLFFQYWSGTGGTLYIDQITVVRETVSDEPANMWFSFSDSTSANVWNSGLPVTWLESYENAEGVLKIENSGNRFFIGNTNGVNWPAAHAKEAYSGATGLKFRLRVENSTSANQFEVWGPNDWYQFVFTDVTTTDGWVEYTIPFDPETQFDILNNMYFQYWSGTGGTLYIDEITVAFGEEEQPEDPTEPEDPNETSPANVWNDFSAASTANIDGNGATVTWLESYEGEDGVLKIQHNSGHKWINTLGNWPAAHSADSYAGVLALKLRLRLEDNEGGNMLYLFSMAANADGSDLYVKVFDGVVATNGWVEYTIPLDVPAYYDALHNLQLHYWSGDGSTLYIDEITVVFDEEEPPEDPTEPEVPTEPEDPNETTPANVWNDFSAASTANIDGNGATVTWLESYEGEDGVLKIQHNSGHKWINTLGNWPAAHSADSYAGVLALKLRLRLEDNEGGNMLYLFSMAANADGSDLYVKVFDGVVATNGWVEYTIPLDVPAYYDALHNLQLHYWSGDGSTLYIDEITVIHSPKDIWNDFSDSACASVWHYDIATLTWLESYEGAEGVFKIENSGGRAYIGNTNGINWGAAYEMSEYKGVTSLKFRVLLEDDSDTNQLEAWYKGGSGYEMVFTGLTSTDGWTEFTIPFDPATQFDLMDGMFFQYWSGNGGTLYIDEITVVREEKEPEDSEETVPAGMWNDFTDSSCASVWHYDIATLTWLESYEGAEGVFKIENSGGRAYIGNTNGINWGAAYEMSEYEGATSLKFRVLLEDDSDGNQLEAWYRGGSGYEMVFTGLTSTDGWTEFTIPFNPATQFDLMNGMFFQYWSGNGGTLYIDQITAQ